MLESLRLKNFALIDNLEIEFSPGLTVMTGETGAGKTMIVEALNFVCGERSKQEFIRSGFNCAVIEASFSVKNNDNINKILKQLDLQTEEDLIIIKRELSVSGKNKCLVNGSQITLSMLKQLGDVLVDIHGQHEHQSLLFSEKHLHLLDDFAQTISEVSEIKELYYEFKEIESRINNIESKKQERLNKIDFITFQINEIDDANLAIGEDKALEQKSVIIRNAEKISASLNKINNLIYEGNETPAVLDLLDIIKNEFKNISKVDSSLNEYLNICENTYYELKEMSNGLSTYLNSMEFNPNEQIEIEERLALIQKLKKKYGDSIEDIFLFRTKIQKELDELNNQEENVSGLKKDLINLKENLTKKSIALSKKRNDYAGKLKVKIEKELGDLGMKKTNFLVKIIQEESNTGEISIDKKNYSLFPWGIDKVEFYISTNPGEEPKPLAKIASGGEISRIMLALKAITSKEFSIPTILFDEIDVGVSGSIASKIGKKIKNLSANIQTICITHLPQIASMGDIHFYISKNIKDKRTITEIQTMKPENRIKEIARMLSGEKITDLTLQHAEELLTQSSETV